MNKVLCLAVDVLPFLEEFAYLSLQTCTLAFLLNSVLFLTALTWAVII